MGRLSNRALIVIVAGCAVSLSGFGVRSSFGLVLEPMTAAHGWSRETFALALAIQNLMWGITVPIAGAIADRYGASRMLVAGAVVYSLGTWGLASAATGAPFPLFAGLLAGIGLCFTAFSISLAVVARPAGS